MKLIDLRHIAILTILFCTTTNVLAAPHKGYKGELAFKETPKPKVFKDQCIAPASTYLDDGFYAGIQAGYETVRANETLTSGTNAYYNHKLGANGWTGGIYLGDGRYFKDTYYLGVEAFGNLSNNFTTSSNASIPVNADTDGVVNGKMTVGNNYGISLIPGFSWDDHTLVYARLGYKWSNFKYSTNVTYTEDTVTSSGNSSKILGGFNAGIGLEKYVYGKWSVRGEYTYTNYGSANFSFANVLSPSAPYNVNLSPSDNQFSLGLTYHIA